MNEATQASIEALNAVANSLDAPLEPKRFERRNTVVVAKLTGIEDIVEEERADAHSRRVGVSHMDAMLESKNAIHGDFDDDASTAQDLKRIIRAGTNWEAMPAVHREALEHTMTKVARILAGDFNHPDHWKDLQGYPRLVEKWIEAHK